MKPDPLYRSLWDLCGHYDSHRSLWRFARDEGIPAEAIEPAFTQIAERLDAMTDATLAHAVSRAEECELPLHFAVGERFFRVQEFETGFAMQEIAMKDARSIGVVSAEPEEVVPEPANA